MKIVTTKPDRRASGAAVRVKDETVCSTVGSSEIRNCGCCSPGAVFEEHHLHTCRQAVVRSALDPVLWWIEFELHLNGSAAADRLVACFAKGDSKLSRCDFDLGTRNGGGNERWDERHKQTGDSKNDEQLE